MNAKWIVLEITQSQILEKCKDNWIYFKTCGIEGEWNFCIFFITMLLVSQEYRIKYFHREQTWNILPSYNGDSFYSPLRSTVNLNFTLEKQNYSNLRIKTQRFSPLLGALDQHYFFGFCDCSWLVTMGLRLNLGWPTLFSPSHVIWGKSMAFCLYSPLNEVSISPFRLWYCRYFCWGKKQPRWESISKTTVAKGTVGCTEPKNRSVQEWSPNRFLFISLYASLKDPVLSAGVLY